MSLIVIINSEITFISDNVKGIQNSVNRIKLLEYLKSYVTGNGFIFLQEKHSCINDEIKWSNEFNGELFFSNGKKTHSELLWRFTDLKQ